jgi:hypothetical protein
MPRERQLERGIGELPLAEGSRWRRGQLIPMRWPVGTAMAGQQIQHALPALDIAFVQRLVLIVVVGRCGIGLAHNR